MRYRKNQSKCNPSCWCQLTSDDAARNAVLMETTKSIFAITPSGYLDGEVPSDGRLKIVEVVKCIAGRCCCEIIMLFECVLRAVAEKWHWTTF